MSKTLLAAAFLLAGTATAFAHATLEVQEAKVGSTITIYV